MDSIEQIIRPLFHIKTMCIKDRYELPDNKNILIFNQRKGRRPDDGMVSASRGIPVVGSVHASTFKIMSDSETASTMIHEYAPTSI